MTLQTVGHVSVQSHFPELKSQLDRAIRHARLQGINEGLNLVDTILVWLSARPRIKHEKLDEMIRLRLAEVESKSQELLRDGEFKALYGRDP